MTPLLAALSSFRLVATSSVAALSFSPACAASRKPRMAVRSEDFTDLLRRRLRSLVRLRFSCDLMLATRQFLRSLLYLVGVTVSAKRSAWLIGPCSAAGGYPRAAGRGDCPGYQAAR